MKRFFPLLILLAVIGIFFRTFFFQQQLPIPSDTIVGLYNPFRDLYAVDYPRGIPFKNFLITDPVRQQYPWRFESILQEKSIQFPLWNPYNFAGSPLLANQQSAALTPLNALFFLLPFPFSWSLLIVLQPIFAGTFLYLYLRNLKLRAIPSLLGSISFVFSGFFIAWLEWGTIDMTVLWAPLILLSVDKVFGEKKYSWYVVYFLANATAFLSGHLQTFVYIFLLAHVYLLARYAFSKGTIKTLLIGLPFGAVTIAVTSIQWYPLLQFIFLSGRNSDLLIQEGWFIPLQHLITFFVPDFFGNPTTLNYWGVWNYGELAGYIGIPALLFVIYTFFSKMRKVEWFFLLTLAMAFLFALPTPFATLPLTLHIPFLSTAQPTRQLSVIDFSLCILSAFGMHKFMEKRSINILLPIAIFFVIFIGIWGIFFYPSIFNSSVFLHNITIAKRNTVFPTIILIVTTIAFLVSLFLKKRQKIFFACILCILLINTIDGLRFAEKFTPFTQKQYLFPSTKSLHFLQKNIGNFRIMTTDSQLLPPNFSIMYHLQSIDGYDPLYIKEYGEFVVAMERNKPDIASPFGFNRLITPHGIDTRLINLLGVKYIFSLNPISSPHLTEVFKEGQTIIYENKDVFPRAFFVKKVENATSEQQEADFLFTSSNNLLESASVLQYKNLQKMSPGIVNITHYSAGSVVIKTKNEDTGFLVLTDSVYPSWHAYIDGKETKIYTTDIAFRGVVVPRGTHVVTFSVQLF